MTDSHFIMSVSVMFPFVLPFLPTFRTSQAPDSVMLSIVNILAVIYVYHQFSSLRKAGSKYLLGNESW